VLAETGEDEAGELACGLARHARTLGDHAKSEYGSETVRIFARFPEWMASTMGTGRAKTSTSFTVLVAPHSSTSR
jgi:hypothetical protein